MNQTLPQNYSISLPLNNSSITIKDTENNNDASTFIVTHNTNPIKILITDSYEMYDN